MIAALLDTLPGYGSLLFDANYNIARGIIEKIGVGKIVRRDPIPASPSPDCSRLKKYSRNPEVSS
jgi:hypothetical protein